MPKTRPLVLTIGGFDPSAGAGVLADIKTFEQHKVYGMAVNTANTVQNDNEFVEVNWIDEELVLNQLDILLKKFNFEYIKIGLIPNFELILKIVEKSPISKIIWDPILRASANFDFKQNLSQFESILKNVFLITPNSNEAIELGNVSDSKQASSALAKYSNIYLKGGHSKVELGKDYLYSNDKVYPFNPKNNSVKEKHGSGCILSSALTANLALGYPLVKSCLRAKTYTEKRLGSNESLLSYHK